MNPILESLIFVRGAVATKDFIPAMTHFNISGSRVTSYNGQIALSSPIDFDIDCNPKAISLIKAIDSCNEVIKLTIGENKKLTIKSGKFRANVDCIDEVISLDIKPEGAVFNLNFETLIESIKKIRKFIGNDASRPWTNGILFHGQSIFATNNVCLVEAWIGEALPTINIPESAVVELLRIKETPIRMQVSDNNTTFHYSEDKWLRSQLFSTSWPDLYKILNVENTPNPIPKELFEDMDKLKPFLDDTKTIYFKQGSISTHETETEGASFEAEWMQSKGCYGFEMMHLLEGVAEVCDFSRYPKPALFFGGNIRGAIIGKMPKDE